jgi:large subunit ribosomal protein L15
MKLNELRPQKGATKRHKRLGHGPGSGRGKTSTRGHKGDRARSGYIVKRGYEGGQMPITRRIPKRGFVNIFRKHYEIVNVQLLEKLDADTEVTPDYLKEKGYIKGGKMLKILGQGELSKSLFVKAHKFSKTAEEKILKAKGKIEKLS